MRKLRVVVVFIGDVTEYQWGCLQDFTIPLYHIAQQYIWLFTIIQIYNNRKHNGGFYMDYM